MSRKRILELLEILDQRAIADLNAGRLVVGDEMRELVRLVKDLFATQKKKQGEAWRRWYQTKGKQAQQRRKEREALGPHKYDEPGPNIE